MIAARSASESLETASSSLCPFNPSNPLEGTKVRGRMPLARSVSSPEAVVKRDLAFCRSYKVNKGLTSSEKWEGIGAIRHLLFSESREIVNERG